MAFNPQSTVVATGSMDTTAKLWDVQKGAEISTLSVSHNFIVCTLYDYKVFELTEYYCKLT